MNKQYFMKGLIVGIIICALIVALVGTIKINIQLTELEEKLKIFSEIDESLTSIEENMTESNEDLKLMLDSLKE